MTDTTGTKSAAESQDAPEIVEPDAAEQPNSDWNPDGFQSEQPEPVDEKRGNAEAAKYRTQLRAAEATIADHESHVAELQTFVIAGLISDRVADPKVFDKLVDREAWA